MKGNPENAEALRKRAAELREAMKRSGMTYREVEAATGLQVRHSTICRMFKGKVKEPKPWQLEKIAKVLGVQENLPFPLDGQTAAPEAKYEIAEERLLRAVRLMGAASEFALLAEELAKKPRAERRAILRFFMRKG